MLTVPLGGMPTAVESCQGLAVDALLAMLHLVTGASGIAGRVPVQLEKVKL